MSNNYNKVRGNKSIYDTVINKTFDFFDNAVNYGLIPRYGQTSMSAEIIDALSEKNNIIVEAGVGIGKSYAYLVPLIYLHKITSCNIVISTSTIALQEQLINDIENLEKVLGVKLSYTVAKGKSNFLCLEKAYKFVNKINLNKQDRKHNLSISEREWKSVCVEDCKFDSCDYKKECEFYNMRKRMVTSNIIVCNHNLLIVDLLRISGRNLLNNPRVIVCDEAHNLEGKFRDYFTKSINPQKIIRDISKLKGLNGDGIIDKIIECLQRLNLYLTKETLTSIQKLNEKGIDVVDCEELEFSFNQNIEEEVNKILFYLNNLEIRFFGGFNSIPTQKETIADEIIYSTIQLFRIFIDKEKNIYWLSKNKNNYIVSFVPKSIAKESRNALTSLNSNFILTSATLSTENQQYDYILNGLGLNDSNYIIAEPEQSPFDYNSSLLYLCNELPNPKDKEDYLKELYKKIIELIKLTNGKTLVLFTSKTDMNYVYEKIKGELPEINIYIQNNGSSQEEVKEKFKKDINSVLLSTGTFWEGIDIKGESLSSVIIARLPFPVVTPYLEYKYKEDSTVYLNEMLIKLKQGCGRLVRSENDKGLISILDSRVTKKNYLTAILSVLPNYQIATKMEEVVNFVENNILNQKRLIKQKIDNKNNDC